MEAMPSPTHARKRPRIEAGVLEGSGEDAGNRDAVAALRNEEVSSKIEADETDASNKDDHPEGGDEDIPEELTCGICFSEEVEKDRGILDSCQHIFCFACIMEWAKVESRCPMCKRRFTKVQRRKEELLRSGRQGRQPAYRIPLKDQKYLQTESELLEALEPYAHVSCMICSGDSHDNLLLLCDSCDRAAHTFCVGLARRVPEGTWLCPSCMGDDAAPFDAWEPEPATAGRSRQRRPSAGRGRSRQRPAGRGIRARLHLQMDVPRQPRQRYSRRSVRGSWGGGGSGSSDIIWDEGGSDCTTSESHQEIAGSGRVEARTVNVVNGHLQNLRENWDDLRRGLLDFPGQSVRRSPTLVQEQSVSVPQTTRPTSRIRQAIDIANARLLGQTQDMQEALAWRMLEQARALRGGSGSMNENRGIQNTSNESTRESSPRVASHESPSQLNTLEGPSVPSTQPRYATTTSDVIQGSERASLAAPLLPSSEIRPLTTRKVTEIRVRHHLDWGGHATPGTSSQRRSPHIEARTGEQHNSGPAATRDMQADAGPGLGNSDYTDQGTVGKECIASHTANMNRRNVQGAYVGESLQDTMSFTKDTVEGNLHENVYTARRGGLVDTCELEGLQLRESNLSGKLQDLSCLPPMESLAHLSHQVLEPRPPREVAEQPDSNFPASQCQDSRRAGYKNKSNISKERLAKGENSSSHRRITFNDVTEMADERYLGVQTFLDGNISSTSSWTHSKLDQESQGGMHLGQNAAELYENKQCFTKEKAGGSHKSEAMIFPAASFDDLPHCPPSELTDSALRLPQYCDASQGSYKDYGSTDDLWKSSNREKLLRELVSDEPENNGDNCATGGRHSECQARHLHADSEKKPLQVSSNSLLKARDGSIKHAEVPMASHINLACPVPSRIEGGVSSRERNGGADEVSKRMLSQESLRAKHRRPEDAAQASALPIEGDEMVASISVRRVAVKYSEGERQILKAFKERIARKVKDGLLPSYKSGCIGKEQFKTISQQATHAMMHLHKAGKCSHSVTDTLQADGAKSICLDCLEHQLKLAALDVCGTLSQMLFKQR